MFSELENYQAKKNRGRARGEGDVVREVEEVLQDKTSSEKYVQQLLIRWTQPNLNCFYATENHEKRLILRKDTLWLCFIYFCLFQFVVTQISPCLVVKKFICTFDEENLCLTLNLKKKTKKNLSLARDII